MTKPASLLIAAVALTVVFAGSCVDNASNGAKNAETAEKVQKAVAAAPTRAMLSDLELRAFEAWKSGNPEIWQDLLSDSFVSFREGQRRDKSAELVSLGEHKCTVTKRSISDETMVPVGTDAVVLTARAEMDAVCDGRAVPTPMIVSTLFIRIGSDWKIGYRNEVAAGSQAASAKPAASTSEPITAASPSNSNVEEAVIAAEQGARSAFKSRTAADLGDRLTEDVTLVDRFGNISIGKQAVVTALTAGECQVARSEITGPVGTQLSRNVSLLTYRVQNEGKCDGKPLLPSWGTSIYQRVAGEWKAAYIFETPLR